MTQSSVLLDPARSPAIPAEKPLLRQGCTVADLQRTALDRWPDRVAVVVDGVDITYRQFDENVNRIARLFYGLGLRAGQGFAILASNRVEVLYANWAAQLIGLRYTPLHPKGSLQDHIYILRHAEISALLIDDAAFGEHGRQIADACDGLHVLTLEGSYGIALAQSMAVQDGARVDSGAQADGICNIFFTGGTTGKPKGAVHRHESIVAATTLSLAHWDWPEEIRFLIATPVSHAGGAMVTPTLLRGGSISLMKRFRAEDFLARVEKERITAAFLVPTMIYDLLDCPSRGQYDTSSLKMVIYGAAAISPDRLKEAIEAFGPVFCQLYGQTEVPNLITYLSRADHRLDKLHRLSSCGRPVPGNQVKLIREDGSEAPRGDVGEICVRGPLGMTAYWKDPEQTADVFRDDWLHTGDLARMDEDGYLYIVDRAKDLIITGGFNVFSREVEDALANHPAVAAAAVVGLPHERWGEAVSAFVVLKKGMKASEAELVAHVRTLKGNVLAPKTVKFIDQIPLTSLGKPDKKSLKSEFSL